MKKLRSGTQLKLTNSKNAGRKAIHDIGIRHIKRTEIKKASPLHLTIKLNKADIQNKTILKMLRYSIYRARLQGLKIIHYSLEYNHVHLYAECCDNQILAKGMKALGVSFVKQINKLYKTKGSIYKHRYHFRVLKSASEVRNVINYILKNGIKHRRTKHIFNPYNSAVVIHDFRILDIKLNSPDFHNLMILRQSKDYKILKRILNQLILFKNELRYCHL